MEMLSRALFIFGSLQILWASIWFLVVAFRLGAIHGLLMLFLGGIYQIIFSIMHWEEAKKPFFTALIAIACLVGAALLSPKQADSNQCPDNPKIAAGRLGVAEFKQRLANAIAAQIAARLKHGASKPPSAIPAPPIPQAAPPPANASPSGSNAAKLSHSLLALVSKEPTVAAAPPVSSEWDRARALLRVGGVMQTGTQIFATVNQQVLKVNEELAVELDGKPYRFKIRRIDLRTKLVQFDPIE